MGFIQFGVDFCVWSEIYLYNVVLGLWTSEKSLQTFSSEVMIYMQFLPTDILKLVCLFIKEKVLG